MFSVVEKHSDEEKLKPDEVRAEAFPYGRLRQQVWLRYRDARRAHRALRGLGMWLAERKRWWPLRASETVLEGHRRVAETKRLLKRLGFRVLSRW